MRAVKRLLILTALLLLGMTFTAQAQEDLTETFTAADDSYTFDYPRGWQVFELEDSGSGILMNQDVTIIVSVFAPLGMETILAVDQDADIEDALDGVVGFLEGEPTDDPISDSLGGREVLHVEFETADAEGWGGVIEFSDGGWGGLMATFSEGAPRDRIDTLLAVLETLDGTGSASNDEDEDQDENQDEDQQVDGDNIAYEGDDFAFLYPADWFINDESGTIVTVSNLEDVANGDFPNRGYLWVALLSPGRVSDISGSDDPEDIFDDILGLLEYDYGRLEEEDFGERTFTVAAIEVTDTDGFGYVIPFSDGESFGFAVALAPAGEFEDYEDELALIIGSFDNEVEETNCCAPATLDGDFPSSIDNFDGDIEDAVSELLDANVVPDGGSVAFDGEGLALDGEINTIEPIGGRTTLSNFILSGELTFEPGGDEIEICMFSLRLNVGDNTFIDIGLVNTGSVAMLDVFDADEDATIETSAEVFDLEDTHHFLIVVLGEEMTVYVDGDLVFERLSVVDREGGFGIALVGAGRRASCEAENVAVFSLDGLEITDNGETPDNGDGECTVSPVGNSVNIRSGPGTEFAVQGTLDAGDEAVADGQTTAALGAVWWRLEDGGWVRNDTVEENGACASLPTVTP